MIMYTLRELENAVKEKPRQTWGKWRYDPKTFYLTHNDWYPVDLKTKDSNSKLLDLIFQINTKESDNWDSNCVSDLIRAIDDIFYPQANCCSGGADMKFDVEKLCKEYNHKLFINGEVW